MAKYGISDLVMTAGEAYHRTFLREVDSVAQAWTGRVTRLQMKTTYNDALLIELTAFLVIDPDDATKLHLDLPGDFTPKLAREGVWDLYSTGSGEPFRLPKPPGRIIVLQGATASG